MLRYPIRLNQQQCFWGSRIICPQMHPKLVWAGHPCMHHIIKDKHGFCAWVEGRRTDDSRGRSATLDDFDLGFVQNLQGLIPHILQPKGAADRFP